MHLLTCVVWHSIPSALFHLALRKFGVLTYFHLGVFGSWIGEYLDQQLCREVTVPIVVLGAKSVASDSDQIPAALTCDLSS